MDYEKKYNEALERAKNLYPGVHEHNKKMLEQIFPELRESEDFDEEVRKWLVGYFSSIKDTVWIHRNTITCEQILEWLEKQKEQMLKEAVKWLVDDDYDELADKGRFILGSAGLGYNGYYIPYSDLLKLPKEGEK